MYGCPNCGANLKFDISRQKMYCAYCDSVFEPYDIYKDRDADERTETDYSKDGEYEVTVFRCPQCAGEIMSEDDTAATFCSFCGASTILDSRISKEKRPNSIIPFKKTKEDCIQSYKKMMRKAVYAPDELKDENNIRRFRGIYMPYWVYSFKKTGPVTFSGTRTHRSGDYKVTRHYKLSSNIDSEYSGIVYDASSTFSDNLSSAIAPFNMNESKEFTPSFLSGFYADTGDVPDNIYVDEAKNVVAGDGARKMLKYSECKKHNVEAQNVMKAVRPSMDSRQLAMLPVWFLSYRSKDRVVYAVVNGQTGKVAADLPVDFKKYLIGSLVLALPIFVLLNLFLTINPTKILVISCILALLSILISSAQCDKIYTRENSLDDKGISSVENVEIDNERQKELAKRLKKADTSSGINILKKTLLSLLLFFGLIFYSLVTFAFIGRSGAFIGQVSVIIFYMGPIYLFKFIFGLIKRGGVATLKRNGGVTYKVPFKDKLPTLIKPLIGVGIAILVFILHPAEDMFYYVSAIIIMAFVGWSFWDLIQHHNMLTTRKLPQLGRRGGDENA